MSASLVGLKRENIDDIYHIYCNHAAEVGFSVRKSQTKYNVAKVLVQKWFVCSCEGTRKKKTPNLMNKEAYKRPYITRTNCKAILKAKLNDEGVYEVFEHNMDHNHILSRKEWSYMHRSERSISSEKAVVIEDLVSSGLKATDSFRYMVYDAGGEHIIGHTKKDHLNFVNKLKMEAIEGGDAQTLIDNLSQQSAEDVDFFYRVKLDDDGRLCNVFWRDSMMKEDYMIYGDVVVFDTTYRTNRYNLICAPFVGINNHWKNVMFGCAFISNEKTESFEWLFEVFKKSMGGQSPITLFTDQDKAIANGIEKAFPTTRHRLCIWHLYQNAISHFGKLKSDKGFNEAFQKCLTGCSSGEEFEDCWRSMIEGYSLQDNSWFARLYCLREKWSTGYNKDFFSAGILSSQRSESTNHALGFNAKKTTSLSDFYIIFQKTVEQWRSTEAKDEFQCSRANPTSCLALTGLLKHASEVYTLTLFRFFESEFLKSISTSTKLLCEDGGFQTYQVTESDGITSHCVSFYAFGNLVSCSCKNFEECGLLCCHSLRILHAHSVPQIPDCYIKRRWRKFVKQDIWDKSDGNSTPKKFQKCAWRNQMMRKYYNLILKAQESEEARKAVEDGFNSVVPVVDALVTREKTSDAVEETCSSHQNVLDPSHSITKGRKKERIKAHQKTKKSKTSNPSSSTPSKEFGTKTPNPRSF